MEIMYSVSTDVCGASVSGSDVEELPKSVHKSAADAVSAVNKQVHCIIVLDSSLEQHKARRCLCGRGEKFSKHDRACFGAWSVK